MGATAVAALAMAALTASQAPGVEPPQTTADDDARVGASTADGTPGDGSYHTELPPLDSPTPPGSSPTPEHAREGKGAAGIPATVLAAYRKAERSVGDSDPGCGLPWELLAAIGKVESGQARGGAVDENGTTLKPILGPVLNGAGFANITDTDQGVFDGDTVHDRAVGPMQFIPGTWSHWGADGNGDGRRDPNNVFDAALAAGHYLCAGERDLTVKDGLDAAILSYNHSGDYLRTVLSWLEFYRDGVHEVPDGDGVLPTSPGAGGNDEPGDGGSSRHSQRPTKKPRDDEATRPPEDEHSTEPSGDETTPPASDSPTPTPTQPTPTPTETTPDPVVPTKLARVDGQVLIAQQGMNFTAPVEVVLTGDDDKVMPDEQVRFTVSGDTGTTFAEGATTVTETTGTDGVATAPTLHAGDTSGEATVSAVVVGHDDVATDITAKVLDPTADKLVRTDENAEYTAEPGQEFADRVQVEAIRAKSAVKNVKVTATMLTKECKPIGEDGPHFLVEDKPLHEVTLPTGEDGTLQLPVMEAGGAAGTYTLRLTTPGVDEPLDITLTVTEPDDSTTATPAP